MHGLSEHGALDQAMFDVRFKGLLQFEVQIKCHDISDGSESFMQAAVWDKSTNFGSF